MKKLILASQSPRRSEILQKASYQFVTLPVHVSEIPHKNLNLDEQIIDIARRKARACAETDAAGEDDAVILAADTLVCLGQETLGKPGDEKQAFDYLSRLSGGSHQVKTALFLIDLQTGQEFSHLETTEVFFKELSDEQIKRYISTGEPMDKAGAYAIQGGGAEFVERFEGDFNNVVGLPLQALEKIFKLHGWTFGRNLPAL